MGTWYEKEGTTELHDTNDEREDEDGFGYSSDRGISWHSIAWRRGQLREKNMLGGKKGATSDVSDDKDKSNHRNSRKLISVLAGISGSPAGNTRAITRRVVDNEMEKRKRSRKER